MERPSRVLSAVCLPCKALSKARPWRSISDNSLQIGVLPWLQGHEDLRQDERVMQLFGLVNTMLANDRTTAERDLSIARYAVIPLSPNSGLIGWVSMRYACATNALT